MWEIIKQIWGMKWYEVFVIAICDDAILMIKLWPVWGVLVITGILVWIYKWGCGK
jgi:hypothetical protein